MYNLFNRVCFNNAGINIKSHSNSGNINNAGNNDANDDKVKQVCEADIIKSYIKDCISGTMGMSEEEKKEYSEKIHKRYYSGKKLTTAELNYLRMYEPDLYLHARRTAIKRHILEDKLRHCRTKKQARQVLEDAHLMISDDDPDKDVLHAVYNDVWKEFRKKGYYSRLKSDDDSDKELDDEVYSNKYRLIMRRIAGMDDVLIDELSGEITDYETVAGKGVVLWQAHATCVQIMYMMN